MHIRYLRHLPQMQLHKFPIGKMVYSHIELSMLRTACYTQKQPGVNVLLLCTHKT